MNAVRMSHYPPDEHFLDACDSLGLFVLDELGGWQKYYDEGVGRPLVKAMVERDRHRTRPRDALLAKVKGLGFTDAYLIR